MYSKIYTNLVYVSILFHFCLKKVTVYFKIANLIVHFLLLENVSDLEAAIDFFDKPFAEKHLDKIKNNNSKHFQTAWLLSSYTRLSLIVRMCVYLLRKTTTKLN